MPCHPKPGPGGVLAGLALLGLALGGAGCKGGEDAAAPPPPAEPAAAAPRLVLLYVPCTVNRSYLAPYSGDVPYTPHLEAFAREGVVFDRHQSEAALSGIAYASIFSGTDATHHHVFTHPRRLTDAVHTVAEAFSEAGYEPFFFDRHGMASAALNYAQGVPPLNSHKRLLRGDDRYFRKVIDHLRADPSYRAFVMTAFMVSHAPYASEGLADFCAAWPDRCPQGLDAEELHRYLDFYDEHNLDLSFDYPRTLARLEEAGLSLPILVELIDALYSSRIHYLDELFGGVVAALRDAGLLDESLIAFTADHGEVMTRDTALFRWNHGFGLAPEALAVPWILRGAGLAPGRYTEVTRSMDVYPTLAGLVGLDVTSREEVTGTDLSPVLRGEAPAESLPAFSETSFIPKFNFPRTESWSVYRAYYPRSAMDLVWVSLRRGDLLFKWRNLGDETFGAQAFDLAADPQERHDLFDPEDPEHRDALARLREHRQLLLLGYAEDRASGDLDVNPDDQTRLLRSLGYVP